MVRWAHQGGAREGPSNTVHAMARAWRGPGRATALELDVRRARDGVVVVIHDRTLERTTDGQGRVARRTVAELQRLDAAHWWVEGEVVDHDAPPEAYVLRGRAPADPTLRVPTLTDVLEAFPDAPLTIEVKAWRAAAPLAAQLAAAQRPDVTVTSFLDPIVWMVRRARRRTPGWRAGLAPGAVGAAWLFLRVAVGLPPRSSRYTRVQVPLRVLGLTIPTRRFVDGAHRAGIAVDVWTIDDPEQMAHLLDVGVDGIMTDVPSVLAEVVDRAAPGHAGRPPQAPPRRP